MIQLEPQTTWLGRLARAARLEATLYDEVARDTSATPQALAIMLLAMASSAVGAGLEESTGAQPELSQHRLILEFSMGLVSWFITAYLARWCGKRFFAAEATLGQLVRTLGFAAAPAWLSPLSALPRVGGICNAVVTVWFMATMVLAVRQALGLSTPKATVTTFCSYAAANQATIVLAALATLVGPISL